MGCSASQPTDDSAFHPQPSTRQAPQTSLREVTSQTAINANASSVVQARPIQPSSTLSVPSHSNISTPRRSTSSPQGPLASPYNLPLCLPAPWSSKSRSWTSAQLTRERYEFFETRVTGRPEVWAVLKQVAELLREGDIPTAQGMIEAAGVTLPTGNIVDGCYDEVGNLYRLPAVVVLDPLNIVHEDLIKPAPAAAATTDAGNIDGDTMIGVPASESKSALLLEKGGDHDAVLDDKGALDADTAALALQNEEKGKSVAMRQEPNAVRVKCRLSDRGGPGADIVVMLGKEQTVGTLAQRVARAASLDAAKMRVRIAFLGKMLNEAETLEFEGWVEGHVVNAFVVSLAPPQ